MPVNSRNKGSRNERSVASIMKAWTGYEFARTPQSGGLHWKKSHTSGDIVCIDDKHGIRFQFSIECKFHEDLDILHLISGAYGKKSVKILDFWKQSETDARAVSKIPIVFMRRNGMKKDMHFVMLSEQFFVTWLNEMETTHPGGWENNLGIISYIDSEYNLMIMNSEDLMKTEYLCFHKAGRKLTRQQYGNKK